MPGGGGGLGDDFRLIYRRPPPPLLINGKHYECRQLERYPLLAGRWAVSDYNNRSRPTSAKSFGVSHMNVQSRSVQSITTRSRFLASNPISRYNKRTRWPGIVAQVSRRVSDRPRCRQTNWRCHLPSSGRYVGVPGLIESVQSAPRQPTPLVTSDCVCSRVR
ncbi:hypothetical protein J6590_065030 [Homalodisca vitripennis]|nr:hypothetical protein J6590_065030 [Homalodisca vitripennis]